MIITANTPKLKMKYVIREMKEYGVYTFMKLGEFLVK